MDQATLGDGFIKLIKMVTALRSSSVPQVSGIAHIQDAKKVGRVGIKALVYFEIVSTFALISWPCDGQPVPGRLRSGDQDRRQRRRSRQLRRSRLEATKSVDFVLNIIPDSAKSALLPSNT